MSFVDLRWLLPKTLFYKFSCCLEIFINDHGKKCLKKLKKQNISNLYCWMCTLLTQRERNGFPQGGKCFRKRTIPGLCDVLSNRDIL